MRTPHVSSTLTLPPWRATLRRAVPNVIEGKVVPVVVFVGLLEFVGTTAALLGALAWSVGALVRRKLRAETASGILILTTIGLVARTVAALATGSLLIYFLQPTLATGLVALAFVGSVLLGRPLAERLMLDIVPIDDDARDHPALQQFLSHVSLWWGFTSTVNFAITVWLLTSQSATTFVLVKSVLGPITTTMTLVVAFFWFRALMARSGTQVVFAEAAVAPAVA